MRARHVIRSAAGLLVAGGVIASGFTALFPIGLRAEAAPIAQAVASQAGQGFPGGANSLQEMHGDWRVACAQPGTKKVCALSQQQTDPNTRQLVLAVELNALAPDRAEGTLILPFGLALEKPITLHVDEAADGPGLRVRTCLPVGCLVGLTFDPTAVALLKKGTVLAVTATADGGQQMAFLISLKGFSDALERTWTLVK